MIEIDFQPCIFYRKEFEVFGFINTGDLMGHEHTTLTLIDFIKKCAQIEVMLNNLTIAISLQTVSALFNSKSYISYVF